MDCPQCGEGTNTKAAILNHYHKVYSLFCNACGYNPFEKKGKQSLHELKRIKELNEQAEKEQLPVKLPDDFTNEIPLLGRLWLYKSGISESVIKQYNIGYSEKMSRVILPVYDNHKKLVWLQCRAILDGQKPKYLQPKKERRNIVFCSNYNDTNLDKAVIVEDILSAIRVGKTCVSYSLLGTKITTEQANTLGKYNTIITWLDGDKAGKTGSANVRHTLGLLTNCKNIRTDKDPKKYNDQEIRDILCQI